jgi:hypothetical protein
VQAGPGHSLTGVIAEISVEARHLVVDDPPAVGVVADDHAEVHGEGGAVAETAPYWTWSLVWRRTESQPPVLAAAKALTDDRGAPTFGNGVAWLPSGDPYRPGQSV